MPARIMDNSDVVPETMEHDGLEPSAGEVDEIDEDVLPTTVASEDFKVIGNVKRPKVQRVTPILPKWMVESTTFDGDLEVNSSDLQAFASSIDSQLLENLGKAKIEKLFPVQKAVIPVLLESFRRLQFCQPRDVCVLSPTGSGKTLAFVIPIVNHLLKRVITQIRVLIILPVSDLAVQVHKVFQSVCKGTTLRVGLATSSANRKGHKNGKTDSPTSAFYRKGVDGESTCLVDILVATPGKLIDLIQRDADFTLKHLEILVIDEADRMMNETQFSWLREIEYAVFETNSKAICPCTANTSASTNRILHMDALTACSISPSMPPKKSLHKILFSATLTSDPEKIDSLSLYYPTLFNVSTDSPSADGTTAVSGDPKQSIPANLKEYMIIAEKDRKPLIIWYLVKVLMYRQILCFTDSVESTHRLYELMKQIPEIVVSEFSSKQNSKKRAQVLTAFEAGTVNMIISTDIFARGLDVNGISCVICYDPPRNETAYIHRIGRTARAGAEGTALSLVTPQQLKHFTIICRRAHKAALAGEKKIEKLNIKESDLKPLVGKYQEALKQLESSVTAEDKATYLRKRRQISKCNFNSNGKNNERHKRMKQAKKDATN